jgi:hypothetical protein
MHDCVMLKRDLCRNYARPKVALTRAIITARKRHGLVGRRSSHLIIFISTYSFKASVHRNTLR